MKEVCSISKCAKAENHFFFAEKKKRFSISKKKAPKGAFHKAAPFGNPS